MGWYYSAAWATRKDVIAELTKGCDTENVTAKALKHCYRGNAWSGVLWTVVEIEQKETGKKERYIACDLIRYSNVSPAGFGYKPLDESMGPYYYSCPLGYLDMVTEVKNQNWRDQVEAYHAKRKAKFPLRIGLKVKLTDDCNIPEVTITNIRPIMGIGPDRRSYKLKWKHIESRLVQT